MHAFDVLGDPVRRRILELLATREHASGEVVDVIAAEFGISQAAVSQHLKVLRESGFAQVRPEGTRRVYTLDASPMRDIPRFVELLDKGQYDARALATSVVPIERMFEAYQDVVYRTTITAIMTA